MTSISVKMGSNTISVFHPFEQPSNFYLKEIEKHFDGFFRFGNINDSVKEADIIHIHWPEALYNWKEPGEGSIQELEDKIIFWKEKFKIIYTRHNEEPHHGGSKKFSSLYNLVEQAADGIIHLGRYSHQQFINNRPDLKNVQHVIIPHPIYTLYPNNISSKEARQKLNLKEQDKIILCLGNIRNKEESIFLRKVFQQVSIKHKILVAPTMDYYVNGWSNKVLSRLNQIVFRSIYAVHPRYRFENRFLEDDALQVYLNAADCLFIPRLRSLNSGLLLLGMSFGIPVVCSHTGNNTEVIEESHAYGYESGNIQSAAQAIEDAMNKTHSPVPTLFLEERSPSRIATLYHSFCTQLINGV